MAVLKNCIGPPGVTSRISCVQEVSQTEQLLHDDFIGGKLHLDNVLDAWEPAVTLLIGSIFIDSPADLREKTRRAWTAGADAVELRIDRFTGDPNEIATFLSEHRDQTWIVTCRSDAEGGHYCGSLADRVSLLIAATRQTGAYVDFEFADFERSDNIRQKVILAAKSAAGVERLILSAHVFEGVVKNPKTLFERIRNEREGAVAKIAHKVDHIGQSFAALDLMHQRRGDVVAIAMGESGLWTRVLAKKLGAFASYAAIEESHKTAPGQLELAVLRDQYRWGALDADTRVFGVVGDPIAHSFSPRLFNFWFERNGVNAVYLPLLVDAQRCSLQEFIAKCLKRPWLNLDGVSVTIPHKRAALDMADSHADDAARQIGAVNTLRFHDGSVIGFNTDWRAAIGSLEAAVAQRKLDWSGLRVDVLGAGGAARAVLFGLREKGCEVTVYGRSEQRTAELASRFSCRAESWSNRHQRSGAVLINTTPIGMWPNVVETPMHEDDLGGCELVFDLIYRPQETRLLQVAQQSGCATLNGLDMFVRQAAAQFEHWFEQTPDLVSANEHLSRILSEDEA